MQQIDQVSILTKANVYFNGQCVSHTLLYPDGSKKSVGVILPGSALTFTTGVAEKMEIVEGNCRINIANTDWQTVGKGQSFNVAAQTSFQIQPLEHEPVHYICHFG
jgi:uncharacterized protein YaiE (UPF0345 family)